MDKEKSNQINELKEELRKIDERIIEISNKGTFFSFFIKSFIIAVVFVLISKFFNLSNEGKIIIFVLIFIITNLIQAFLIKNNKKDELKYLHKKQIKIQAEIFKLTKDLK